jgi:uncharacterized protein (DUF924 family)
MILTMLNMLLITQGNRLMQRDATKAMVAQRKIKEESKEALNRAADLESQKFNGVRHFEYPPDNKGLFAFCCKLDV